MQKKIENEITCSQLSKKKSEKTDMQLNKEMLLNYTERKWINKCGKGGFLDFTDEQINKLKECFNSLDDDGSGAIGIDELEGPLIGLGFFDTREQIEEVID